MFLISKKKTKKTSKTKKKNIKKAKETKVEKRISPENRFENINLRSPGSIFFSSLAFPKTKGFFFGLMFYLCCIFTSQGISLYFTDVKIVKTS